MSSDEDPKKPKSINIQDIWPQEREIIERPERYKYVRKIVKPDGCVFCAIEKETESFETLCLYKSKEAMVVLNKYPYNSGHLLVLPSRHCGDVTELSSSEYTDLNNLLLKAITAVKKEYDCAGLNIGMNHGKVAGAGIPDHLHWHIVPRWLGDTNFFPLIAETKVLPETLEQTYNKLRPYFLEGNQ